MKLTTLNLQGVQDWTSRQPLIVDYLRSTDSDVVLFQEVVYLPELSPFNQAQQLNAQLGYPYEFSSVTRLQVGLEYDIFREGLLLLSKFPVVKTDTVVLKQAAGDQHNRIIQLADIFAGDSIIKVANVHFSLTDDADYATAHLQETLDILASRGETRIIAGDFNLNDLDQTKSMWQSDYVASTTFDYESFPGMAKRNDYVLIPKPMSFQSLDVSQGQLSDHRAVTVTITTT